MKLLKINLILLFSLVVFQFISFPQLYSTNQVKLFTPLGTDNFGYTLNTNLFWSIEIDSKGNIWAGSYYQGLFKYGNSTWTNFPGTKLHMGDLLGLEVDNNDNIWLASNSNKEAVELRDTTIYRNTVPDSLSSDFLPGRGYFACVISSGNNIYYAGYDSCLYKFDGNTFTTFTVEGRGSPPNGYLYGLAVDKNDHIWYGTIYNSVMEFDGQNFIPHHPTTGNNIGSIYSITVDNYNNKWICGDNGSIFKLIGNSWTEYKFSDMGLIKGYPGSRASDIAVDSKNNLWMATDWGILEFNENGLDSGGPTDIENSKQIPQTFSLSQNYPNPFNPSTIINYEIPKSSLVTLKVYDILGREVATLVNEEKTIGRYNISFDASKYSSGVYFYRITAGDFSQIKKMVLLK